MIRYIFFLIFILLLFSACEPVILGNTPPVNQIDDENEYYVAEIEEIPIITIDENIENVIENSNDAILRLSMRNPLTLNPLLNEDVTVARILRLIFEPLIILDTTLRPTAHLADIEFASDFSSANLTVRNDAIWSDGLPVTADDIIFSIDTLKSAPDYVIYKENVRNIAHVSRVSTRTVQIVFNTPTVTAGYALSFPIIPMHHFQGETVKNSHNNMHPIGNGSFKFESNMAMRGLTLIRNPYSFRSRAQIEQVDVQFLPNEQTELYAFDQGRIDALPIPLTEWVRHHGVRSFTAEIFPAMYFEFIGFNFQKDIFRELHTRQGIAHAFDATTAISAVYLDHAIRASAPIHPYNWAAGQGFDPAFDQARAQALLDLIRPEARPEEPLIILVNKENPQRVSIARRLAESLNNVGLPAGVLPVSEEDYFYRLENHEFDLFIGGVNLSFTPNVQFMFQHSDLFVNDPWLNTAFNAMMVATTESAYLQAVSNFQQVFTERLPVIGLAFRHSSVLTNLRISQNVAPQPDNVFHGLIEWEIIDN